MIFELQPRLVERLDIAEAVQAEAANPIPYLPSRVGETTLRARPEEVARIMAGRFRTAIDLSPAETVWAPKPGRVGRYRPISSLSLRDRLLFRTLEQDVQTVVRAPNRGSDARQRFQTAVLKEDVSHVVVADVASFYFFVDHELLETRLVEATSLADTAAALRLALSGVFGRPYGLPQNFRPSDVLSELFISPVERRLLRQGILTARLNDDFRLGASTWGNALRYLEVLQQEVSRVGLDLNAEKSWILRAETYQSNLGLADQLFQQALEAVQAVHRVFDPYTGEPLDDGAEGEDDPAEFSRAMEEAFAHAAGQLLQETDGEDNPSQSEARAAREIITAALFHFTRIGADTAVEIGPRLVALDPLLAQQYSQYLRVLPEREGHDATAKAVMAVVEAFRGHVPPWTQAWLFDALLRADASLTEELAELTRRFMFSDAPSVLRARAATVLAAHRRLGSEELTRLVDDVSEAARVDLAAAAGLLSLGGDHAQEIQAFVDADPLYRLIFDHAVERSPDLGWL
jgi:hypothetical protein